MDKKFNVCVSMIVVDPTTKIGRKNVVMLNGEPLDWDDAKELRKANKGSWIQDA